jgi:hypothetical protein
MIFFTRTYFFTGYLELAMEKYIENLGSFKPIFLAGKVKYVSTAR